MLEISTHVRFVDALSCNTDLFIASDYYHRQILQQKSNSTIRFSVYFAIRAHAAAVRKRICSRYPLTFVYKYTEVHSQNWAQASKNHLASCLD
jgi:hypothetical protein